MEKLTSEDRMKYLEKRLKRLSDELPVVRKDFLAARARKNHVEGEIEKIHDEMNLIRQGQLSLGDLESA